MAKICDNLARGNPLNYFSSVLASRSQQENRKLYADSQQPGDVGHAAAYTAVSATFKVCRTFFEKADSIEFL